MVTSYSNGFRHPLGNGYLTETRYDSDGYYIFSGYVGGLYYDGDFNTYNPDYNSYHLGEDWNGDGGGNTDLGDEVFAISNGQVTQAGYLASLGNYVVIRHDLQSPITVNGIETSQIVSLYAHLQHAPIVSVGALVTIGQPIGQMGYSGDAGGVAHLHFEIRLGTQYHDTGGYENPVPSGWVDPTEFINSHRTLSSGNRAPTIAVQNTSVAANQSIAASSFIASATDPDIGDSITQYRFWDGSGGGGHFTVNGVVQSFGQWIVVAAGNLSTVRYVGGSTAGSETLYVDVYDGEAWASSVVGFASLTATTIAVNDPPVVTGQNASVAANGSVAASSLFSVTDAQGVGTIVRYDFWDGSNGAGYFTVNGVAQAAGQEIFVDAANLGTIRYVGGSTAGSEALYVRAYDGTAWSNWSLVTATTIAPASGFDITFSLAETLSAYQSAFDAAAQRWENIITGDLPPEGSIDDIVISVQVGLLGGATGALANARPLNWRDNTTLPYSGEMGIDGTQLSTLLTSDGIDIITHEIGHALGFTSDMFARGGLTAPLSIFENVLYDAPYKYIGDNALEQYRLLLGDSLAPYVPLETSGGAGTAGSHWNEWNPRTESATNFGNEIMTGYIGVGSDWISRVTIGALEDLGYTVDYVASEAYNYHLPAQGAASTTDASSLESVTGAADVDLVRVNGNAKTPMSGVHYDTTGYDNDDKFVFNNSEGCHAVADFAVGGDLIDLTGATGLAAVAQLDISDVVGDVEAAFDGQAIALKTTTAAIFTDWHLL